MGYLLCVNQPGCLPDSAGDLPEYGTRADAVEAAREVWAEITERPIADAPTIDPPGVPFIVAHAPDSIAGARYIIEIIPADGVTA